MTQEVGSSQRYLEEVCGSMLRESEGSQELYGGGESEVASRSMPGLPLQEEPVAGQRAQVGVRPRVVI